MCSVLNISDRPGGQRFFKSVIKHIPRRCAPASAEATRKSLISEVQTWGRQLKMSSCLAQEVHLARRHEEILAQRSELLQQMETYLRDKKTKKTWQTQAADAAHKRNAALLNDIEAAEKRLQERMYLLPHPDTVKLETLYWASIKESLPKWEEFLLGRAEVPIGFKKMKATKQSINYPEEDSQK
ncbi:centrosomal protein 15 isoform 1-T1 [Geothlypis trichas]